MTLDADADGRIAAECGGDDCDDHDSNRYPGNTEVCDAEAHDEDCDPCTVARGTANDGDSDRDGHLSVDCSNSFDSDGAIPFCRSERVELHGAEGLVSGRDCNDENAAVRPGANETCNGVDDDCDGELDNGLRQTDYYPDCDRDGQGDSSSEATPACALPVETPPGCKTGTWEEDDNRDCDDSSAAIFVGAPELCDGVDNNCNGLFEALDPDNDGYSSCEGPIDCENDNPLVHPGATEELDGVDNDCNGLLDAPGEDEDRDGAASVLAGGVDCDDQNADNWPGGPPAICSVGASYACDEDGNIVLHDECTEPSRQRCGVGGCLGVADRVFVGARHTCAILTDGSLKCWGFGGPVLGQQDGVSEDRGTKPFRLGDSLHAIPLGEGRRPVEVAILSSAACALLDNGEVKCWGQGNSYLLSSGSVGEHPGELGDALAPLDFGGGRLVMQLVAGERHFCALLDDQSVKCWGQGWYGQLGNGGGNTSASTDMSSDETTVNLGTGVHVQRLGAGMEHTCAILEGGSVKCWGQNSHGQLGLGVDNETIGENLQEMGDALALVDLGAGRTAVDISGTQTSTCALMNDGEVLCWGEHNELGRGYNSSNVGDHPDEMGDNLVPVKLGTDQPVARLESGRNYHCALFDNGTSKCWGSNGYEALGGDFPSRLGNSFETSGDNLPYTDLGGGLSDLSAGTSTTCGILADTRELVCVGQNERGNCGAEVAGAIGDTTPYDSSTLKRVALGSAHQVVQISVGNGLRWFGAVLSDGQVKTWGSSVVTGHGGPAKIDTLEELSTLPPHDLAGPAVQVVGSGFNACALLATGGVQCWGQDSTGVLGWAAPYDVGNGAGQMGGALPILPLGTLGGEPLRAIELTAGQHFVCALLEDATMKCWGRNDYGLLGLESNTTEVPNIGLDASQMGDALQSVDLGEGARVKQIATADHRICALLESNEVKCWGENDGFSLGYDYIDSGGIVGDEPGEMGDGLVSIPLPRSGTIDRIALVPQGLCALYDDGVVSCFGAWFTEDPADALALDFGVTSPVVDLVASGSHACVLFEDGALTCLGNTNLGAAGLGHQGVITHANLGASTEFVDTEGWRPISQIAAGHQNTCALQNNGRVKCWGYNAWTDAGYFDPGGPYAGMSDTVLTNNHLGDEPSEMGIHLPDLNVTY